MKKAYLGIDCGSVGIKLSLIDENKEVIRKTYLRNEGIIETVKKGLENIANEDYEVKGVGATGSGRKFVGMLIGADVIKTEILAHAVGTLNYYPDVKTILDIGGEDSKIMTLRNGVLEDFVMNQICGAGTGSVVDSIASRMGIRTEDVGDLALQSKQQLNFPGKCGVFLQSSVVSRLNSGADKSDILMGVVNALVSNYLILGKNINLESPFVYQGATSQNKAIVSALEEQLESEITVPKYASYMGAIGIALMAQEENVFKTNFQGYNISDKQYISKTKIADGCDNHCEITSLYEGNTYIGSIGNRCDKCVEKINNKQVKVNSIVAGIENPVINIVKSGEVSVPLKTERKTKMTHIYTKIRDKTKLSGVKK